MQLRHNSKAQAAYIGNTPEVPGPSEPGPCAAGPSSSWGHHLQVQETELTFLIHKHKFRQNEETEEYVPVERTEQNVSKIAKWNGDRQYAW